MIRGLFTEGEFFDFIALNNVVIVDVYATWCKPCTRMLVILPRLVEELKGSGVVIGKLNYDAHPNLVEMYDVRSIPTFLFFVRGQLLDRYSGVLTLAQLKERALQLQDNINP